MFYLTYVRMWLCSSDFVLVYRWCSFPVVTQFLLASKMIPSMDGKLTLLSISTSCPNLKEKNSISGHFHLLKMVIYLWPEEGTYVRMPLYIIGTLTYVRKIEWGIRICTHVRTYAHSYIPYTYVYWVFTYITYAGTVRTYVCIDGIYSTYVCMYVHIICIWFMHTYVCIYVGRYLRMYVSTCIHTYLHICVYMYIRYFTKGRLTHTHSMCYSLQQYSCEKSQIQYNVIDIICTYCVYVST